MVIKKGEKTIGDLENSPPAFVMKVKMEMRKGSGSGSGLRLDHLSPLPAFAYLLTICFFGGCLEGLPEHNDEC